MSELFTLDEIEALLRKQVADAGGGKKWAKKKKATGFDHCLHILENGTAASLDRVLPVIGFQKVTRYEPL